MNLRGRFPTGKNREGRGGKGQRGNRREGTISGFHISQHAVHAGLGRLNRGLLADINTAVYRGYQVRGIT